MKDCKDVIQPAAPQDTPVMPRSLPAQLGIWVAMFGILPIHALVTMLLPETIISVDPQWFDGSVKFVLFFGGAALCGQIVQWSASGPQLRLRRICAAALMFDLVFDLAFTLASYWFSEGA